MAEKHSQAGSRSDVRTECPLYVPEHGAFDLEALSTAVTLLLPEAPCPGAPIGASPAVVRVWFDAALQAVEPIPADTLDSERDAALAFAQLAKAANTRRAYSAAVKAWCAWCSRRDLPPCPALVLTSPPF